MGVKGARAWNIYNWPCPILYLHVHVALSVVLLLTHFIFSISTRVKGTLKTFEVKLSDDKLASLISVGYWLKCS